MCSTATADCPPRPRRRERRHPSLYVYVRRVKGHRYQARVWLPDPGSINLGCFISEWSAGQAAKAFVRRYRPDVPLADILQSLRDDGIIPKHVRLKYVIKAPGGVGFSAKVVKHGRKVVLEGPYHTERDAFESMRAYLAGLPRKPAAKMGRPPSPFVSVYAARRALGLGETLFRRHWLGIFTPPGVRPRVYRDELAVATQAGGGISESAKEAVATFRMGVGRM